MYCASERENMARESRPIRLILSHGEIAGTGWHGMEREYGTELVSESAGPRRSVFLAVLQSKRAGASEAQPVARALCT